MFTEIDRVGIRAIIRDYKCLAMASLSQIIPLPLNVVELETLVVTKALEFALELVLDYAILERDSKKLMNSLMDDLLSLASFGLLIQDVKVIVESFQCISFSHVCRESNTVAYNLARYACHVIGYSVWMEDVSSYIFAIYQVDLLIS